MCRGCGHDAISASVMRAFYESSVDPRKVVKLSGIGCSSKTPAYFMSQSFGFNAVHGRMSAVATGVNLANHLYARAPKDGWPEAAFLDKPFTADKLLEKVRSALDAPRLEKHL